MTTNQQQDNNEEMPFQANNNAWEVTEDGWVEFMVHHRGGLHELYMNYTTTFSNPCLIRIDGVQQWKAVAVTSMDKSSKLSTTRTSRQKNRSKTCSKQSSSFNSTKWSKELGTFDLGSKSPVQVGFKPMTGKEFPNIEAFKFVKMDQAPKSTTTTTPRPFLFDSEQNLNITTTSRPHNNSTHHSSSTSSSWLRRAKTAVTFTFEIGIPLDKIANDTSDGGDGVEHMALCLRNKALKFIFGEAHDTITIDGDPIGDQHGGDNFPYVKFVKKDDYISTITMGLSTYNGEAAFSALAFQKKQGTIKRRKSHRNINHTNTNDDQTIDEFTSSIAVKRRKQEEQKPIFVGSKLVPPHIWTYDRQKLGLNLWITSVCAPDNKPVSRYGFTLSSEKTLAFNAAEFEQFWEWLVQVKHQMVSNKNCTSQRDEIEVSDIDMIRSKMQPLYNFLKIEFAGGGNNIILNSPTSVTSAPPLEGYLYGTRRHVSISYDAFSIFIYRLPDGKTFHSTLFVDGEQYDTKTPEMYGDDILRYKILKRNTIIAFGISVALQDTDLLFQMGLVRPVNPRLVEDQELHEIELLDLRNDQDDKVNKNAAAAMGLVDVFTGTYDRTIMARRVITILALAGLRKSSYEVIMDKPENWDIYDVSAGAKASGFGPRAIFMADAGAVVCAIIQILLPIMLITSFLRDEIPDEIEWQVYVARLLFGLYAILYEFKTWEVNSGDRNTGWLCFLPEFDARKLIFGTLVNKASMVITSIAVIVLMIRSYTIADVVLNALALYFILDVDDNLVDDRVMEKLLDHQKKEYFRLKSKTALEYRLPSFQDSDLHELGNLPARYFRYTSKWISTITMFFLSCGCIFMIVEPWIFDLSVVASSS